MKKRHGQDDNTMMTVHRHNLRTRHILTAANKRIWTGFPTKLELGEFVDTRKISHKW